jgi:hypothetical protein
MRHMEPGIALALLHWLRNRPETAAMVNYRRVCFEGYCRHSFGELLYPAH